jgi:hypothetical protein
VKSSTLFSHKFEQYLSLTNLSKITNSHFHFWLNRHDEESEAQQPPSSLLPHLYCRPSMPGPLPSMMRLLFTLPLSGGSSPSVASSRPDGESHPQTSSSFGPLPPCLQRLSTPPPDPILITSSTRDKGKVSILFGLYHLSPETHLVMFSQNCGGLPTPPPPINIDRKELQQRGDKVSILFAFALLIQYSPLDVFR